MYIHCKHFSTGITQTFIYILKKFYFVAKTRNWQSIKDKNINCFDCSFSGEGFT